jgi:hypothetical protein
VGRAAGTHDGDTRAIEQTNVCRPREAGPRLRASRSGARARAKGGHACRTLIACSESCADM